MSLGLPRSRKQKFLSPTLHKNSPKQKIFKSSPPQYQTSRQNMLIIPPMLDMDLQPCYYSTTSITVPAVWQYQLYYSIICILVSLVLQYHLYYSTSYITVSPIFYYHLYYSTTSITVPAILQYHLYFSITCITVAPVLQ